MTSDTYQQIFDHINKAKRLFIAVAPGGNADAFGSGVALYLFFTKLEKEVELVAQEDLSGKYPFLPKIGSVKEVLAQEQSLAVIVDTQKKPLQELSYQQEAARVKIYLKSKAETFSPEDITFETQKAPYDLGVIIGAQALEDLGPMFEQQADTFYNTPKIVIDNHPGNKLFGQLNLVDMTATSLSEIVISLLQEYETNMVDEDIATSLLLGLIAKTNSFQHPRITPKAFLKASELVGLGARQQDIIKHLFKTKPLPFLKLWGRTLARITEAGGAAYSVLTAADFTKAEADASLLPIVLNELVENIKEKDLIGILAETGQNTILLFAARYNLEVQQALFELGAPVERKGVLPVPYTAWEINLGTQPLSEAEAMFKVAAGKI